MTFESLSPGDVGEVELVRAMFADQAELARLDDGVDLVLRAAAPAARERRSGLD
jgi:hypothetical protein